MKDIDDLEDKIDNLDGRVDDLEYNFERKIKELEEGFNSWNLLSEYTIPYSYYKKFRKIQYSIKNSKLPVGIKGYNKKIKSRYEKPHNFTQKDFEDKAKIERLIFRNSRFLKNSKIFYDVSKNLYWDSKPILSYYAVSYLFSFFVNTHLIFNNSIKHHGLKIIVPDYDLNNIIIEYNRGGLFHRIVKFFSLHLVGSIFSDYHIIYKYDYKSKKRDYEFLDNSNQFSITNDNNFNLTKLINDLNWKYLKNYIDTNFDFGEIMGHQQNNFIENSLMLRNYILVFVACSLSRYFPNIWNEIHEGKNSDIFLQFQNAIESIDSSVVFISDHFKMDERSADLNKNYKPQGLDKFY